MHTCSILFSKKVSVAYCSSIVPQNGSVNVVNFHHQTPPGAYGTAPFCSSERLNGLRLSNGQWCGVTTAEVHLWGGKWTNQWVNFLNMVPHTMHLWIDEILLTSIEVTFWRRAKGLLMPHTSAINLCTMFLISCLCRLEILFFPNVWSWSYCLNRIESIKSMVDI